MGITEILNTQQISKPNEKIFDDSNKKWDAIAKPLNSLGRFEEEISRIASISGSVSVGLEKVILFVFASDNGVVEEGISQAGQDVTAICAKGIAEGKHSVAVMARRADIDLKVVDVGISEEICHEDIINAKVKNGTRNFAKEPAMTELETVKALNVGIELVKSAREKGYDLVCVGEMGIGNTTTSTAVTCSLLGKRAEEITGPGAGLDSEKLECKKRVIQTAIDHYGLYETDPMTVLRTVGGFDIAAMVGAYIGGAVYGIPVVMDGLISAAAALVAEKLLPGVRDYIIPSHMSDEPAMKGIMKELNLNPVVDGHMSLGEGTGAVLMVELLRNVLEVYNHAARFDERDIVPYEHLE